MTRKLLTFSSQRRRENNALNSQDFMILYCWLSVFICAVPGMHQLYFDCHSRLCPADSSFQKDKINDQTMETLSAPHEILSNWQEAKGESTIPSSTPSLNLCQFAWWYRGLLVHCKFYAHKNYRIPSESLEALKITGYFGGDIPVSYKNCFFRARML